MQHCPTCDATIEFEMSYDDTAWYGSRRGGLKVETIQSCECELTQSEKDYLTYLETTQDE